MRTLVTVGTDDGHWAPPKMIDLMVTTHAPSGLGITNSEEVSWTLAQRTCIVVAAIATGTGEWARIDVPAKIVRRGEDVTVAAYAIVIDVDLPTMPAEEVRGQGLLEGRLREILPGR